MQTDKELILALCRRCGGEQWEQWHPMYRQLSAVLCAPVQILCFFPGSSKKGWEERIKPSANLLPPLAFGYVFQE